MRILITGSRDWDDRLTIIRALSEFVSCHAEKGYDSQGNFVDWLTPNWTLVSGNCPTGADVICEDYAVGRFWNLELHPADWEKYGRAAGPIRNKEMVDLGANVCFAFIKNKSRGATGTVNLATDAKIHTRIYYE